MAVHIWSSRKVTGEKDDLIISETVEAFFLFVRHSWPLL